MAWQVTSPPGPMLAAMAGGGFEDLLAIRVDADSGLTEYLVTSHDVAPYWAPADAIVGVTNRKPS